MKFKDLTDFGKHFGIEENDLNPYTKVRILQFRRDVKGNISSSLHGKPVYQDRNSDEDIKEGETWVCKVDMSKDHVYFASTIIKLDAPFYFDLRREQMDVLADNVWERHRDMIQPLMDERYHKVIATKIDEAVKTVTGEYEKTMEEMEKTIADLEKKDSENRHIISSLQQKLERSESGTLPIVPRDNLAGTQITPCGVQSTIIIRREGPDELYSDSFTSHRYFAHFSADQKILLIRPHEDGNIICSADNRIQLGGLGKISYFNGPEDVFAEYAPQYGGFLMRI